MLGVESKQQKQTNRNVFSIDMSRATLHSEAGKLAVALIGYLLARLLQEEKYSCQFICGVTHRRLNCVCVHPPA